MYRTSIEDLDSAEVLASLPFDYKQVPKNMKKL